MLFYLVVMVIVMAPEPYFLFRVVIVPAFQVWSVISVHVFDRNRHRQRGQHGQRRAPL